MWVRPVNAKWKGCVMDRGLYSFSCSQYYLKGRLHYSKNDFAQLFLTVGATSLFSQVRCFEQKQQKTGGGR